jgi:hypothetical protein
LVASLVSIAPATGFIARMRSSRLVVPLRAETEKKVQKIEQLKIDSESLREPIRTEMANDEIFVSHVSAARGP